VPWSRYMIVLPRRSGQEDRSQCGAGAASRFPPGPPRSDARFHFVKRHTRRKLTEYRLETTHVAPCPRQLSAPTALHAGQFGWDWKSDRSEEPGRFHFDEDVGVVEVTGTGSGAGVIMEVLVGDVVSQEGCDQVPEFRFVVPALLPGQPESSPSASRSTSAGGEADSLPKYARVSVRDRRCRIRGRLAHTGSWRCRCRVCPR
jgi:hypothetical protein